MALSGLTFYVGGWFIAVLAFGLIVVLALFFYIISLPNLGFLVGTLGLMGLGLGVSVFWLSITYVSKLIIAFLIGKLLLQRFAPRYAQSNLWPLLLGVVLYALVASIPYLGLGGRYIGDFLWLRRPVGGGFSTYIPTADHGKPTSFSTDGLSKSVNW